MKKYIIAATLVMGVLSVIVFVQKVYVPGNKVQYKISTTDFVEPSEDFIRCYEDTDCIKIKGSACPPSEGGVEVCVNKNYFQEYISQIEKQAGNEAEIVCPQVYLVTNRTCGCVQSECSLI